MMSVRPIRLAVADSPQAPVDERLLQRLREHGCIEPHVFRGENSIGIPADRFDALFVTEARTASRRHLARRFRGRLPLLLGASPLPRFRRGILRHADALFYGNSITRTKLIQAGIAPERLFFLPPHPFEPETPEEQRKREEQAGTLRTSLELPAGERLLLFAGEFSDENAPGILLESFLLRKRENALPGWTLALAGSGPLEGKLRELAGTSPHVRFLPPAESSAVMYRVGDLVALPSKRLRTGERAAAAIRVLAASRPLLATENAGDALELVTPGETGWSVDSAHPELWFDYIRGVPAERLRRMGEAAREAAAAWSFDAAATALERAAEAIPDFFMENGG